MFDHDIMVEHVPDHDIMVERVLHHFQFIPNHDNMVEHGQKIDPQNNMVRTRLNMVKHVWQCLTMISWSAGKQGYVLWLKSHHHFPDIFTWVLQDDCPAFVLVEEEYFFLLVLEVKWLPFLLLKYWILLVWH